MDKNAVNMTMENSQLKKLLAEVSLYPNVKHDAHWGLVKTEIKPGLFHRENWNEAFWFEAKSKRSLRLLDCSHPFIYFYLYQVYTGTWSNLPVHLII